ncbi:MAG: TonB-dependent receptor [Rhodospirillales bacterium]|nr:TonB-dependent receptor [Rhodospirillales bacterium]
MKNFTNLTLAIPRPRGLRVLMCLALALPTGVLADEPKVPSEPAGSKEEIIVTATRVAIPLSRVSSSVTVITADEIMRRQLRTLPDVLEAVPGLRLVQQGGAGHQTSIFSRGTNSNHTLILVDGIEVADPSNPSRTFETANFLASEIERVEVVRGSQGALYGSDAIGSVINIVTKRGVGAPSFFASVEGGGFDTVNSRAGVRGATERLDYNFSVEHFETNGETVTPAKFRKGLPSDEDGHQSLTVSGKFGVQVTDQVRANVVGRYIDTATELDEFQAEDPDSRSESEQYFVRTEVVANLFDGRWDSTVGAAYTQHNRTNVNPDDVVNPGAFRLGESAGEMLKFDWQNDVRLIDGHVFTLGFEDETERFDRYERSLSGGFSSMTDVSARANIKAFYFQDGFEYFGRLFGTAGVRVTDHDRFGTEVTYQFAPVYQHPETGTRVKASVSTGFRAPSLAELFGRDAFDGPFGASTFVGNPDLDPEESIAWEIGVEQELLDGRVELGATYFDVTIDDLITTNTTFTSLTDRNEADIHGVESFVDLQLLNNLSMRADFTFTRSEDNNGFDLLRRPKKKLDVDVNYRPLTGANLGVSVHYVDPTKDFVGFSVGEIGGHTVVNLTGSYDVLENVTFHGRIDNLFNREYLVTNSFRGTGIGAFFGVTARM